MKKKMFIIVSLAMLFLVNCSTKNKDQDMDVIKNDENETPIEPIIAADVYSTDKGELKVTLIGHASLMFEFDGKIIHVDPYSNVADYALLPKADLIMITHEHADHLDTTAINNIKKENTRYIVSEVVNGLLGYGEIMGNGSVSGFEGIDIKAVPAYNMVNKKPDGEFYHPQGRGNGYILSFGDKKVYIAGDTENIPDMETLKESIEIAFLPKNLPYTMSDDMFVDAAIKVSPRYLYPYHFSEYDQEKINKALGNSEIEIIVKPMSNK